MAKKVLKDFSELKAQQRIDLLAFRIYQIQSVFNGQRETAFEPRKGTELYRIWNMRKLSIRQQQAWRMFRDACEKAIGASGAVTAPYGETISGGDGTPVPVAYTNEHYRRIHQLFTRHLHRREAALLHDLMQDDLRSGTGIRLEYIGLIRSGYGDEETARAAGVAHVQTLLDRIADFFGF